MLGVIVGVVVAFLLLALAVAAFTSWKWVSSNNRIAALDARCDTAFADIDVHLKHRHDLIPRLVELLRNQTGYEKDMVLSVANARTEALRATTNSMRLEAEKKLSAQVFNLISNIEKSPELRSLPDYRDLRDEITGCDNRITAARRFFNLAIEEYNMALGQWPTSSIAAKRSLSKRQPFDLGFDRVVMDEPAPLGL